MQKSFPEGLISDLRVHIDNRIFRLFMRTDGIIKRLAEAESRLKESTERFANVCQTASLELVRERLIKSFEKILFVK